MTQDEIVVSLARLIELQTKSEETAIDMIKAAVLVEREACAKLLDAMAEKDKLTNYYKVAAKAIRERGLK